MAEIDDSSSTPGSPDEWGMSRSDESDSPYLLEDLHTKIDGWNGLNDTHDDGIIFTPTKTK